jgi:type IV pilus assembly protein PilB
VKIFKGKGCPKCNNTGYKGRVGLFEVMQVTPTVRDMILSDASVAEIRKQCIEDGMLTLRQSGLAKIRNGVTTIEEVIRETF